MAEREVQLRFEAVGAPQVAAAISRIGTVSQAASGNVRTFGAAASTAAGQTKMFATNLLLLPGAIVNSARLLKGMAVGTVGAVMRFAELGDQVVDTRSAFMRWAETMGGGTEVLRKLKEATGGETSALELQQTALHFARAGIKLTADELALLFRMTKQTSDATGEELVPRLQGLARAMATGRIATLTAALGIERLTEEQIRARFGLQGMEEQLDANTMRTVALTLAKERAAEVAAVFSEVQDTAGDALKRATVGLKDFRDNLAAAFVSNEQLIGSIGAAAEFLRGMGVEGETAGEVIGRALAGAAAKAIEFGTSVGLFLQRLVGSSQWLIGTVLGAWKSAQEEFGDWLGRTFPQVFGAIRGEAAKTITTIGDSISQTTEDLSAGFIRAGEETLERWERAREAVERARREVEARRAAPAVPEARIQIDITRPERARPEIEQRVRETMERLDQELQAMQAELGLVGGAAAGVE